MIKTIIKNHPFRDIVLDFNDAVVAPDFEQHALGIYYEAHDRCWTLKQHTEAQLSALEKADVLIGDLSMRRLVLEQELELIEEALKLKEQDESLVLEGEFTIDIAAFFETGDLHNEDLQELFALIYETMEIYNQDIDNLGEDDQLIAPVYFEVLSPLYQRYPELSVDTVSLDEDHQDFLGAYGDLYERFFYYLERSGAIFEQYADLVYVCEAIYRRMERVRTFFDDTYTP